MIQSAKIWLSLISFGLFSIILVGLFSFVSSPDLAPGLALSYIAGLSMIFLPCTLPLVFIIIPMILGKNYKRGLIMAILFGVGLSITFMIYGYLVAFAGQFFGISNLVRAMLTFGGVVALIFGLSELRLINFRIPFRKTILPTSIQRGGNDYLKSFFLGFFLGNAGVGCPNPAFYILMGYIATLGDLQNGLFLGLIHGLGRATPLLLLSILAILGINATGFLTRHQADVKRFTGWSLIWLGSFILVFGVAGMKWFEDSIIHQGWNRLVEIVAPTLAESASLEEQVAQAEGFGGLLPWIILALIIGIVVVWDALVPLKPRKEAD